MKGRIVTVTANGVLTAVGAASVECSSTLVAGKIYQCVSNIACWIKQGFGAQTAVAASANQYIPPNTLFYIHGSNGTHLSVIQDAAGGKFVHGLATEI